MNPRADTSTPRYLDSDNMKPYNIAKECDGCGCYLEVSKYKKSPILCRSCAAKARWTDESRKEFGESRKGENNPNHGNIGEKNPCFGRTPPPDELERLSESHKGEKNGFYGKRHTTETRDILSAKNTGENNPNFGKRGKESNGWKGGLTPRMQALRNTRSYKNWRESVYERDDHTCQECGARSHSGNPVYLNAHHINPIKDNKNTLLIFDIDNGITLCKGCHNITKGHEDDFIDRYIAAVHN